MKTSGQSALVALGANLPEGGNPPEKTLEHALRDMEQAGFGPITCSRFFATPCFPPGAGPDYVNAAARVTVPSGWDARRVLDVLHAIEDAHGRHRVQRWGMRTLDLDLLAMGDMVLPDLPFFRRWLELPPEDQARQAPDRLVLPHPRLQDRAFVLVPLMDVAPEWRHPVTGQSVAQMVDALSPADRDEVRPPADRFNACQ